MCEDRARCGCANTRVKPENADRSDCEGRPPAGRRGGRVQQIREFGGRGCNVSGSNRWYYMGSFTRVFAVKEHDATGSEQYTTNFV